MQNNIGLCSLNDPIDTTTSQGRLIFNIFASLAEFERDIIRERTQAGLSAARARGRLGGRPRGIPKESEATAYAAETLYREGKLSVIQIAKKLSISKSTLYKYLRFRNVEISKYEHQAEKVLRGFTISYYSPQQLIECGKFSRADLEKIKSYRGNHNRLGFAYQLIYAGYLIIFPNKNLFEVVDEILSFCFNAN